MTTHVRELLGSDEQDKNQNFPQWLLFCLVLGGSAVLLSMVVFSSRDLFERSNTQEARAASRRHKRKRNQTRTDIRQPGPSIVDLTADGDIDVSNTTTGTANEAQKAHKKPWQPLCSCAQAFSMPPLDIAAPPAAPAGVDAGKESLQTFLGKLGLQAYEPLFAKESVLLKDLQWLDDVSI